jgi:hypothetical protein
MVPRRRIAAGLYGVATVLIVVGLAAIVLAAGSGGAGIVTGSSGSATPRAVSPDGSLPGVPSLPPYPVVSASQLATPDVSASPSSSAGPSQHATGFVKLATSLVYFAEDGTVIPVPSVAGLQVGVQKGKAIYQAAAVNPFGLKAGAYAGQFVPLVAAGQADGANAETGGLVLVGGVVSGLIADDLAQVKPDAGRWIVALPVDIRSATGTVQVSFDQFGQVGAGNTPRVQIRFSGALPVDEMIPVNAGYHVLVEGLGLTGWQVIDPTRLSLPADSIDPAHAMNELVIYGNGTPTVGDSPVRRDIHRDGRTPLGQTILKTESSVSVSLVVAGSHADLGPDRILSIGGAPVFVASS